MLATPRFVDPQDGCAVTDDIFILCLFSIKSCEYYRSDVVWRDELGYILLSTCHQDSGSRRCLYMTH